MTFAGKSVLVLEDEPIIGLALEDQLAERGARIFYAERIEEAFAILSSERIDCAILDVNVHGRPSYDLAARLAEMDVPYLFATGYGDLSHPVQFADRPTVSKPYSIDELERALR